MYLIDYFWYNCVFSLFLCFWVELLGMVEIMQKSYKMRKNWSKDEFHAIHAWIKQSMHRPSLPCAGSTYRCGRNSSQQRTDACASAGEQRAQRSSMQDKPVDWIDPVGTFWTVWEKHCDRLEAVGIAHNEKREKQSTGRKRSRLVWGRTA